MGKTLRAVLGLLILFLASGASLAQPRLFSVPGHGSLQVAVPAGWRVAEKPPLSDPPAVATMMTPASGDAFNLQLTILWLDPARRAQTTPQVLKERVQGLAKKMMPGAAESTVEVLELRGASTQGNYFSLTDKASKNAGGDYRYATQGIALTGEMMMIFTLLHRDAAAPEKGQTLSMLAAASYEKGAPGAAAPPRQDALAITESPQGFELAVPVSRLMMILPKEGLTSAGDVTGRGHPRYFNFAGKINVSGWFEPASQFKGAQEHWAGETAAWKKQGLPAPQQVAFTKIGGWDAVVYDIALPAGMPGTNTHIKAHWVEAGTWIDLHVSVASKEDSAANRARLTQFVQTIQVREKAK